MPVEAPNNPFCDKAAVRRDLEITGWRIRLYYWSRNPHVLLWMAAIIIGIGGFIGSRVQPQSPDAVVERLRHKFSAFENHGFKENRGDAVLEVELAKPAPELAQVLAALKRHPAIEPAEVARVAAALRASKLVPEDRNLATAYWTSLAARLDGPGADLLFYAYQVPPPRYANELAGDFYISAPGKAARGLAHYERELELRPDAESVRRKIAYYHAERADFGMLAKLIANPAYAGVIPPRVRLETAMRQRDWAGFWPPLIEMQRESFQDRVPVVLTCIAGGLWLLLAWQIVQVDGLLRFRLWAPLVAIPLGAASTLPVLFLDAYQGEVWGLKANGFFLNDCWFFVAGVGLREELCKLIFFLPFLPVLLSRRQRLEMLIIAGCVGLGFAIEENLNYFRMSTPANAFGRFLTANFLHFAATGVIGLALCDSIRDPRGKWWHFPLAFVSVSFAHGVYDAFLSGGTRFFEALGLSCFILLSLFFFRQAARERGPATDQLFPAATLIIGLSVLVASILVCASIEYGTLFACITVAAGAITLGVFVYMFYILFRDGLRDDKPADETMPFPI